MRSALVILIIATLAGACGKKQAPAAPKAPTEGEKSEDKGTGEAPDTDAAPRPTESDPCEGGEKP
jgi:hypothetical protein